MSREGTGPAPRPRSPLCASVLGRPATGEVCAWPLPLPTPPGPASARSPLTFWGTSFSSSGASLRPGRGSRVSGLMGTTMPVPEARRRADQAEARGGSSTARGHHRPSWGLSPGFCPSAGLGAERGRQLTARPRAPPQATPPGPLCGGLTGQRGSGPAPYPRGVVCTPAGEQLCPSGPSPAPRHWGSCHFQLLNEGDLQGLGVPAPALLGRLWSSEAGRLGRVRLERRGR